MGYLQACLLLAGAVQMISGHSYHVGDCPKVEPMSKFDMEKFLGKWYVIQKTSSNNKHQVLTYSHGEEDGEYGVLENAQRPIIGKTDYSGKLRPSKDEPALMKVKFKLNPGSYDYIVFTTDYNTYAGVFSCQKVLGANRRAASILSRKPTLDQYSIDKIRERLDYFGVSLSDLKTIVQESDSSSEEFSEGKSFDIDPRFGQPTSGYNASDLHLF